MAVQGSPQASNWQLESIEVESPGTEAFRIIPAHLEQIVIFEGISNPGLTGSMTIKDYDAVLEIQEIFAGDKISISMKSKGDSRSLVYVGRITSAISQEAGSQTAPVNVFYFCSDWWFHAITKQVSMAWSNKTVEEMLREVIEDVCGGQFQGMYPVPSKKIERLVTPMWTPAHIIKYLLAYANGDNKESGYVLWDTLQEQYPICMTVGEMFDGIFTPDKPDAEKTDLMLNPPNINYPGSFNNMWVESLYDEMRYLNQGVYRTDIWAFDYDRNKPYQSSGSSQDVNSPHLSFQMPLRAETTNDDYASTRISRTYPNTQAFVPEKEFQKGVDAYRDNRLQMVFSDMLKMNTQTPGNTARISGEIVKVNYPSINKGNTADTRNKMLEGDYLIRDIQHVITNSNFIQILTLVSDGINMTTRTDLQRWD